MRLGLGLGQRRQQHAGENCDNGNHHQQLDQGESAALFHGEFCFHFSQIRFRFLSLAHTRVGPGGVSTPACTIQIS